ncbi:hypothetical protein KFE98_03485 [bacterium SCSIO 12741]|nr:hypothetical protein KFE98_03485 [bacterium SCSIO 12741]
MDKNSLLFFNDVSYSENKLAFYLPNTDHESLLDQVNTPNNRTWNAVDFGGDLFFEDIQIIDSNLCGPQGWFDAQKSRERIKGSDHFLVFASPPILSNGFDYALMGFSAIDEDYRIDYLVSFKLEESNWKVYQVLTGFYQWISIEQTQSTDTSGTKAWQQQEISQKIMGHFVQEF